MDAALTYMPAGEAVGFASKASLSHSGVMLGDIANLSRLPAALRRRAQSLEIYDIPAWQRHVTLPVRYAAERAGELLPALGPWLDTRSTGVIELTVLQSRTDARPAPACMVATTSVAAGDVATKDNFTRTYCTAQGHSRRAFRYSVATGAAYAVRSIRAGEQVETVPSGDLAAVRPGQPLFIATRVGPVQIQREVVAVQPSPRGRSLFVKAADGKIFSVPGPAETP